MASSKAEQVYQCASDTGTEAGGDTDEGRMRYAAQGKRYYQVGERHRQATTGKKAEEESS